VASTVTALKYHLQRYRLPTTGKKAALVDHFYNHITSLSETAPAGNNPTPNTESSQTANSMHLTVPQHSQETLAFDLCHNNLLIN